MALRLSDRVVCGELFNNRWYSTHGWLGLQGQEHPIRFELTGNPDPDLAGWHIRFEAREAIETADGDLELPAAASNDDELPRFAWRQIGPTGTMTAAREVRAFDCSTEEFLRRCELGEPPPTEWKRCLYLEWHGQNGRVVVELVDPVIEFVKFVELKPGTEQAPPAAAEDEAACEPTDAEADESELLGDFSDATDSEDEPQDEYDLIPDELQRQFDLEAAETDLSLENDENKPQVIRELELMDELIERGEGEPICSIFDANFKLPLPDQLDDADVETALKTLLGQLALFGIALDVCEHYTPRAAYRLLLERICPEQRAYSELRGTEWVQHFSTFDFCEVCEAEAEREYEEHERQHGDKPADDDRSQDESGSRDEDVPF